MNSRPPNIETERLLLVCPLPEELESLSAGDFERASLLTGVSFRPNDPNLVWIGLGISGRCGLIATSLPGGFE